MVTNQVIEDIVRQVLERMQISDSQTKEHLLVVHPSLEKNEVQLAKLKNYWHVVEMKQIDGDIPVGIQHAVFLEAGQDLFVKGAIGITDTHESRLLSELMLKNCKVYFVLSHSLSAVIDQKEKNSGKAYINQLLHYKKQLQEFGVCLSPIENVLPGNKMSTSYWAQAEFTEEVLTKRHVDNWEDDTISIRSSTIVTPLARDIAKERGITIHTSLFEKGK